MAFIFYDVETTGADRSFDQILQFAAVLTDDDLNPVDHFEIRSRLLPYIVPSPKAMQVTRVSVDQLTDPAASSHFEMCNRIHETMSRWSPATIVGYNSIKFDEEMLRRAFYCSLLPIYLTNTGGNCRLDMLTLAAATRAFAPEAMKWPINEKLKVSFKLDRLAPENGFSHENAHDALADVHATIFLARIIKDRAPFIWDAAFAYRTRAAAAAYIESNRVFVATSFRFSMHLARVVTALGINPENSSEVLTFDLANDPGALAGMAQNELEIYLGSRPKPVTPIRLNACPVFVPMELAGPATKGFELGPQELSRRAEILRADTALRNRLLATSLAARPQFPDSPHVENQIYNGFYSWSDQSRLKEFHRSDWLRRFEICSSFDDPRLRILGRRLVYCEAPEAISEGERVHYARAIARRIHTRVDDTGPWKTLDDAIMEVDELIADSGDTTFLTSHRHHLVSLREQLGGSL